MTCKHHLHCMYMYRVKGCNETKSGEHCGFGSVSSKVRVSRRQQLLGMSGCEEGATQGAAGTSQWISTKETWAHRHAARGTKNIIWQRVRSGYSSVSTANGYKCWEAPESKLRNHTMCRMSLGACRDCVWVYALCILGQQGQTRLVRFGRGAAIIPRCVLEFLHCKQLKQ